ncbi:MAG: hypothetical protein ACON4X_05040 [Polaribacter sp.]|jgi:hypothetical protein
MGQIVLENISQKRLNKKYNYIKINKLNLTTVLRFVLVLFAYALTAYSYLVGSEYFEYLFTASTILALIGFIKIIGNIRTENNSNHG